MSVVTVKNAIARSATCLLIRRHVLEGKKTTKIIMKNITNVISVGNYLISILKVGNLLGTAIFLGSYCVIIYNIEIPMD